MPMRRWMRQTESSMPLPFQRLAPGQNVLVDAVDQGTVQIEHQGHPPRRHQIGPPLPPPR